MRNRFLGAAALFLALTAVISFWPSKASAYSGPVAGMFEVTGMFSFSKSDYGDGNQEWTRRWTGSLGYHFTELSELEVSFQDVLARTIISGFEDTTFHDRIYSLDWVQSFTGREYPLQPYVKIGVGQLDRDATGSYAGGTSPPLVLDQFTVLAGVGLRVFLSKEFSLRAEASTYLTGGSINTYQKNYSSNFGVSVYF